MRPADLVNERAFQRAGDIPDEKTNVGRASHVGELVQRCMVESDGTLVEEDAADKDDEDEDVQMMQMYAVLKVRSMVKAKTLHEELLTTQAFRRAAAKAEEDGREGRVEQLKELFKRCMSESARREEAEAESEDKQVE
jgi:hypothetical protein